MHLSVHNAVPASSGGAAHEHRAGLAALAAQQQPVSSIALEAVSTADLRAEVRTARPTFDPGSRLKQRAFPDVHELVSR
jgi:hypothetical protein